LVNYGQKSFITLARSGMTKKMFFNGDSRMPWSMRTSKMLLKNSRKPEIKVEKRFGSIFKLFKDEFWLMM